MLFLRQTRIFHLPCALLLFASLYDLGLPRARGDEPPASPFDGKTLAGWTTMDGKPVTGGWEIIDGMIHLKKDGRRAGNIVTAQEYGDFQLSFEWKIAPRGNSGLKYRVGSYGGKMLGFEYQIYDDQSVKNRLKPKQSAGALYDLYEPVASKPLKPTGEFNTARIVVQGNKIEHWLNGQLVVSATLGDDEWQRRLAASKFSDVPGYGSRPRGKIMLTDHGSEVWYRNFDFKPAAATEKAAGP